VPIHVALNHVTRYRYDRPVALSPQVVRLRPAPHCRTPVLSYSLRVEPAQHFINWQQDPFANHLARLVFDQKTTEFAVTVDLVAELSVFNPFDFFLEPEAEKFPFAYSPETQRDLQPYLATGELTPRLKELVQSTPRVPIPTVDFLVAVNQRLQGLIAYAIRMEPGVQTPEHTLTSGVGSCRDTGWLLVQLLRHLGLAARFVSGYLIQLKPDVKSLDGPSGTEVDFTDLHAWCEVFLPGAGWVGLDPTSGLFAGEGHIPVACTPEPGTAAPVSGAVDECQVTFEHHMQVTRVFESPRVTAPYTDTQWAAVLALGEKVDTQLQLDDVRLTMGGEPTFVSVDDREGGEWNTEALGPTKRGLALQLVHKLQAKYGTGGFLHCGQGKWYPGEQLPRWALSICWRTDGMPCWQDPALFADETQAHQTTSADAQRFITGLATRLGVSGGFVQTAYEDVGYHLWREGRLPSNVDPFDARLADELERDRLRRVFTQGLGTPVGYLLPLQRALRTGTGISNAGRAWESSAWFLRGERLLLVPGDSPMGWRLPLASLPWAAPGDLPAAVVPDTFAPQVPLPNLANPTTVKTQGVVVPGVRRDHAALTAHDPQAQAKGDPTKAPARFESAAAVVRTALCVEVRDPRRANAAAPGSANQKTPAANTVNAANTTGVLYVFMPPLPLLEDYLSLLAAVEATAAEQGVKLVLEGYPPPRDVRLKLLQVTPDPGVIEVNVQPVASWAELVHNTEFLYGAAHATRLASEKFMVDGRHTGTGGGNHIVMGGATPADSPFLRRPDVLASLLTYWHNHPSLSFLFSGMFIGPTSQAPRFDEARSDQVYEVEIALNELARQTRLHAGDGSAPATPLPPWVVDRTLRNLLVDATGNTHRSEFCIDKLYSPDGPTGRLGLLEMRAFEMPPHARMSLAQQLLLRVLVAHFWRQGANTQALTSVPASTPTRLARWGTSLHDRFMLPSFVQMDFDDVLADLQAAGFAFDTAWFAPHFEFRFPLIGTVSTAGLQMQLRTALEPWHVMGEEGAPGGTARYVDSSLERLEIKVTGLNPQRQAITVNGHAVPLQPTGRVGEFVCGVRYRAWQPPSALHPTIGVHAPLTFDVVDTALQRSLGGCRYFVAHPGGRSYDDYPVNAYTAESRRLARFFRFGHTPGTLAVKPAVPSLELPFTLDLRRA
jgi:uncharacterized protein (DUF2126 family)